MSVILNGTKWQLSMILCAFFFRTKYLFYRFNAQMLTKNLFISALNTAHRFIKIKLVKSSIQLRERLIFSVCVCVRSKLRMRTN